MFILSMSVNYMEGHHAPACPHNIILGHDCIPRSIALSRYARVDSIDCMAHSRKSWLPVWRTGFRFNVALSLRCRQNDGSPATLA